MRRADIQSQRHSSRVKRIDRMLADRISMNAVAGQSGGGPQAVDAPDISEIATDMIEPEKSFEDGGQINTIHDFKTPKKLKMSSIDQEVSKMEMKM